LISQNLFSNNFGVLCSRSRGLLYSIDLVRIRIIRIIRIIKKIVIFPLIPPIAKTVSMERPCGIRLIVLTVTMPRKVLTAMSLNTSRTALIVTTVCGLPIVMNAIIVGIVRIAKTAMVRRIRRIENISFQISR
jgi:hypothetical protein